MSEKFNNKYRVPPARAQWWDYANAGAYFITVCTKGMTPYFGHVENEAMVLNNIGQIVAAEWLKTFEMRPDMNLEAGEFVVMPNHFHAVIFIGKNKYNSGEAQDVSHKFGQQGANLGSVIRGFKSSVTRQARLTSTDFEWQRSYHEHIIRTAESFDNITNYIINNPGKWHEDRFYRL